MLASKVEGDKGGPGSNRAGSLWEEGEETAGNEIPKGAGVGRHRKSISQHYAFFCNRKITKAGGGI